MKKPIRKFLNTFLSFVVAGIFLYLAFRGTDFNALWQTLIGVNYLWVLAAVPIHLLSHWLRAVRWKYMLKPIKSETKVGNLFAAVMVGNMVNNGLPRVGEVYRCYVIKKLENVSGTSALGTVVLERILDLIAFGFILCFVLFVYPSALDAFVNEPHSVRPLFLFGGISVFFVFLLMFLKSEMFFGWSKKILPFLPKRFRPTIAQTIEKFISGLGIAKMKEYFALMNFYSVAIWGLYALGVFIPFYAFGFQNQGMDFSSAVILLTVSSVAFVLPAPGAFGTYHSFMTFALVKVFGINPVTALSYSIITHELGAGVQVLGGLYYFIKSHLKISDFKSDETLTNEAKL